MARERERRQKEREHLHRIHLDQIAATFSLGRPLTCIVFWRNFKSLADVKVAHFDGHGIVRDFLLGVVYELCRDKDSRVFMWQVGDERHRKLIWPRVLVVYLAALFSLCCQLCSPGATGHLSSTHLRRTERRCCPPCLPRP